AVGAVPDGDCLGRGAACQETAVRRPGNLPHLTLYQQPLRRKIRQLEQGNARRGGRRQLCTARADGRAVQRRAAAHQLGRLAEGANIARRQRHGLRGQRGGRCRRGWGGGGNIGSEGGGNGRFGWNKGGGGRNGRCRGGGCGGVGQSHQGGSG